MYRNFISFWRGAENLKLPMSPSDLDKTLCAPKFPGSSCCSCMAVLVCPEAELFGAWPSTAQLFGTLVSGGWEMGRMLLLFHSSQRHVASCWGLFSSLACKAWRTRDSLGQKLIWGTGIWIAAEIPLSPLSYSKKFCECSCALIVPVLGLNLLIGLISCLQFFYITWDSVGQISFSAHENRIPTPSAWSINFTQHEVGTSATVIFFSLEAVADPELILSRMSQCFL